VHRGLGQQPEDGGLDIPSPCPAGLPAEPGPSPASPFGARIARAAAPAVFEMCPRPRRGSGERLAGSLVIVSIAIHW